VADGTAKMEALGEVEREVMRYRRRSGWGCGRDAGILGSWNSVLGAGYGRM